MKNGTSLPEQALFYYVHSYFPDAINRYTLRTSDATIEIDIYIPSLELGIEYDGTYWHKKKATQDNRKNQALNSCGIFVIRLREPQLPLLQDFKGITFDIKAPKGLGDRFCEEWELDYIKQTMCYLFNFSRKLDSYGNILQFKLDIDQYKIDLPKIYGQAYNKKVDINLSDICGSKFWDASSNFPLILENIPRDDWAYGIFRCSNGNKIVLPRYHRHYKTECAEYGKECSKCCYELLCPFMDYCVPNNGIYVECQYMENKIFKAAKSGDAIPLNFFGQAGFESWLFRKSRVGIKLIEYFLLLPPRSKYRRNILKFLHLPYCKHSALPNYFDYHLSTSYPANSTNDIELIKKFRSQIPWAKIDIHDLRDPDHPSYISDNKVIDYS